MLLQRYFSDYSCGYITGKCWTSKRREPRVPFDPPILWVCYKLFCGVCYKLFWFVERGSV